MAPLKILAWLVSILSLSLPQAAIAQEISPGRNAYNAALQAEEAGAAGKAREDYDKACQLGYALGCHRAAIAFNKGVGGSADRRRAFAIAARGCELADLGSCVEMAAFYSEGDVVAEDLAKAIPLFEQGCDAEIAVACANLAILYSQGRGVAADLDRSYAYARKSCGLGLENHCEVKRRMEASGRLSMDMTKLSANRDTYLCEVGLSAACRNMGLRYEQGEGGMAKDIAQARAYFERGCKLRNGPSCAWVGEGHLFGDFGYAKSARSAAPQLSRACEYGSGYGCRVLAQLHDQGSGVAKSKVMAAGYYRRACDLEDALGCTYLATVYSQQWEADKQWSDWDESVFYFGKGCEYGSELACRTEAQLKEIRADYDRDIAAIRARQQREAVQRKRDRLADIERLRASAMRGVGQAKQDEPEVCGMIYAGGRATYECMSQERYDKYYRP